MNLLFSIVSFADNTLVQALLTFPLLLSMVITYRCLKIPDVTIDGSTIIGASICIVFLKDAGLSLPVAVILGISAGFIAGIITGLFIELLRINALLAGILNAFIFYSVGLVLIGASYDFSQGNTIFSWLKERDFIFSSTLPKILIVHPYLLLLLIFISLLLKYGVDWFLSREWGVVLRGAGGNDLFLQLRGVNTRKLRVLGFGLANAFAGFGAILVSMYEGSVQIARWPGTIIFALSVTVIGWELARQLQTRLGIKINDSTAVLLGSIVYFFIVRMCYTFNFPTALPRLIIAAYIILVLAYRKELWRNTRELVH